MRNGRLPIEWATDRNRREVSLKREGLTSGAQNMADDPRP